MTIAVDEAGTPTGRWVCLDIGEVLIDETRVWSTWADVLGIPRFTLMAVMGAVIVAGGDHRDAFPRLGLEDWTAIEPEVRRRYGAFTDADLYPDARPTLRALSDHGFRVAVIGNQPASRHDQLRALGVAPDVLVMSDALGVHKPDPAFFTAALEAMGGPRPSAVAYVGDRIDNDVVPAAAAGLRTVWLRRGPWGLLQRPGDVSPDLVIDVLAELPGLVSACWD